MFAWVPWLVRRTLAQFFTPSITTANVQHGSDSTNEPQHCRKNRLRYRMILKNDAILSFKTNLLIKKIKQKVPFPKLEVDI